MNRVHFIRCPGLTKSTGLGLLSFLLLLGVGCSDAGNSTPEILEVSGVPDATEPEVNLAGHQSEPVGASELESNKNVVRLYVENLGTDESASLLSTDHKMVRQQFQNLMVNADDPALEAIAEPLNVAIPDRQEVIEVIAAEGNVVGVQTHITGTHEGNLFGIPATGKSIDIVSAAFYTVEDGKIVEVWEMADEAGLLRQLGVPLPARSDGQRIAPEINQPVQYGGQVLVDILSQPEDSDTYTNKVRVSAYKAQIRPRNQPDPYVRPANQVFEGRPYEVYLRRGFFHVGEIGRAVGDAELGMGNAFPDRTDMVGKIIAEGDVVMMQFLLSGNNTGSLFGLPASNNPIGAWEFGVHTFEGTTWKGGWWFGDDLGMLLQVEAPDDFLLAEIPESAPE